MKNIRRTVWALLALSMVLPGTSVQAAKNSSAILAWRGVLPDVMEGDGLRITGIAGDLSEVTGALLPDLDGTFDSPPLYLESHKFSHVSGELIIGELATAGWVLRTAQVNYGGTSQLGQKVKVTFNGQEMKRNDYTNPLESDSIAIIISQTEALKYDQGGKTVQASVTVTATMI